MSFTVGSLEWKIVQTNKRLREALDLVNISSEEFYQANLSAAERALFVTSVARLGAATESFKGLADLVEAKERDNKIRIHIDL